MYQSIGFAAILLCIITSVSYADGKALAFDPKDPGTTIRWIAYLSVAKNNPVQVGNAIVDKKASKKAEEEYTKAIEGLKGKEVSWDFEASYIGEEYIGLRPAYYPAEESRARYVLALVCFPPNYNKKLDPHGQFIQNVFLTEGTSVAVSKGTPWLESMRPKDHIIVSGKIRRVWIKTRTKAIFLVELTDIKVSLPKE